MGCCIMQVDEMRDGPDGRSDDMHPAVFNRLITTLDGSLFNARTSRFRPERVGVGPAPRRFSNLFRESGPSKTGRRAN